MEQLDGDDIPLSNSQGKVRSRDIVQFVKFNSFKTNILKLSEEVLKEVPNQVEEYYHHKGIFKASKDI